MEKLVASIIGSRSTNARKKVGSLLSRYLGFRIAPGPFASQVSLRTTCSAGARRGTVHPTGGTLHPTQTKPPKLDRRLTGDSLAKLDTWPPITGPRRKQSINQIVSDQAKGGILISDLHAFRALSKLPKPLKSNDLRDKTPSLWTQKR